MWPGISSCFRVVISPYKYRSYHNPTCGSIFRQSSILQALSLNNLVFLLNIISVEFATYFEQVTQTVTLFAKCIKHNTELEGQITELEGHITI